MENTSPASSVALNEYVFFCFTGTIGVTRTVACLLFSTVTFERLKSCPGTVEVTVMLSPEDTAPTPTVAPEILAASAVRVDAEVPLKVLVTVLPLIVREVLSPETRARENVTRLTCATAAIFGLTLALEMSVLICVAEVVKAVPGIREVSVRVFPATVPDR